MQTRNLFLSLFAFAALCACNKEVQPETPQILGEDACLSVRIMATDVATKATEDFESGSTDENAVTNVLFAFFDEEGKFMYTREYTEFSWDKGETTPNVEDHSNATVVLDGKSIVPRQMVVVLNYDNNMKENIDALKNTDGTVADMYNKLTTDYYTEHKGKQYFVMTNSSYVAEGDATGKNAFAAQIKSTDIYNKDAKPTPVPVVDVYVERVAAKLSVTTSASLDTETKTLDLINGEAISYYPAIEGYAFTTTRTSSYLCKNIDGITIGNAWTWNDPTNKRSYWGNSYAPTSGPENLAYVNYDENEGQWKTSGYAAYCNENMTSAHTKLIVKATIKQQMGADKAGTDPALDLVKVADKYYIESELKGAIIAELSAEGVQWDNSGTQTDYLEGDLYFEATGGSAYQVDVKLAHPVITDKQTAAATILAKYTNLLRWQKGQCYFFTDIKHFGTEATNSDYGVVRNHVYKLSVTKISGLGTPFVPGVGGDGGDPVVPEEIDYELQAKINILKWKVVEQKVELQ